MKPALTAEEWADDPSAIECGWQIGDLRYVVSSEVHEDGGRDVGLCYPYRDSIAGTWIPDEKVHAVAALCLHGQEFGFTREDVRLLRRMTVPGAPLDDIADRIEALLPPEPEDG